MDTAIPTASPGGASEEDERIADKVSGRRPPGGKALGTLAVLAVLYTLYAAAAIILPFVLAIILFLLLSPLMRVLTKRLHLPRTLAALLLILLVFAAIGGVGAAISVPASGWIAKAPQSLPTLEKKLSFLKAPITMGQNAMKQLSGLMDQGGEGEKKPQQPAPAAQDSASSPAMSTLRSVGGTVLATTGSALGQVFTVLLLLFFLLSSGDSMLRRLVEVLPTWEDKKRAVQIASEIESQVAGYLATITVMNALVGTAAGLGVWLLGLPDPLLFGTMAFLLNYIPIIGPVTGIVVFFFVGLFTYDQPVWALAPAGMYLGIHVLEGETVTPMLLAKRLTLNPVLVIASLFFWDWMWGVTGALLSVPLLAMLKIVCDHLPGLQALGHMLGGGEVRHAALAAALALAAPAAAQPMLYAQRLPEGTVYVRLVNALPGAASVGTDFAGTVDLGAEGAARVSPYFVAGSAGGKTVALQVAAGGRTATARFSPQSGSFVTVVLHPESGGVATALITDKPEYNQLRARLAFYNASDCTDATLTQQAGPAIFSAVRSDVGAARSVNPVAVHVTASCNGVKAPPLDLGQMQAGGLYTVWLMRLEGSVVAFVAVDTIAPPR